MSSCRVTRNQGQRQLRVSSLDPALGAPPTFNLQFEPVLHPTTQGSQQVADKCAQRHRFAAHHLLSPPRCNSNAARNDAARPTTKEEDGVIAGTAVRSFWPPRCQLTRNTIRTTAPPQPPYCSARSCALVAQELTQHHYSTHCNTAPQHAAQLGTPQRAICTAHLPLHTHRQPTPSRPFPFCTCINHPPPQASSRA